MPFDKSEFFQHEGARIAYRRTSGEPGRAGVVWLGGFHSDMAGEKASSLHAAAASAGRAFVRFDYFGHGESEGAFAEGTVGRWRSDALSVIDELTDGPLVLAGSSMGGWMALLAALARPLRVKGLLLLAPAPDFTERLMWAGFDETVRKQIMEAGAWTRPSPYDPGGYPITRRLIEEGRDWQIMDRPIALDIPVAILQGRRDEDVPWSYARQLVERIAGEAVTFTLVKDGDHRLSRPQDIALMIRSALALADQVDAVSA
ncbi:MAG: alpha/beta fold hydrolase [Alphaproteobacteria bacterium]|nr:alpha/beta fold hydrolase [Alphaproteobacteria bacterium]